MNILVRFARVEWRSVAPGVAVLAGLAVLVWIVPPRALVLKIEAGSSSGSAAAAAPQLTAPSAAGAGGPGSSGPGSSGPGAGLAPGATAAALNKATFPGVSPNSVKVGWAWQTASCGGYDTSAILAGLGINTDWGAQAKAIASLINNHPEQFLELSPAQAAALKAYGPGLWGRKLDLSVYNDFGPSCQDQGRAMAVQAVEQDHVFAMVQNGTEGTEDWVSQEITSRGRIHIGDAEETQSFFDQAHGLAYDGRWGQSDVAVAATAEYACHDLVGHGAYNTGDPLVTGMTRNFGIVHTDSGPENAIANVIISILAQCGATVTEIKQSPDLATSQSQAPQTIAKFKSARVTTVFDNLDWLNMTSLSQAASKAAYFPEWLVSSQQQNDWPSRISYFWDKQQIPNIWGTSLIYSNHEPAWDHTWHYKMWQLANPGQATEQTDWQQTIMQLRTLALGIYGAGPDLTPQTFAQGLYRVANPMPRFDPQLALNDYRPGFNSYWLDFGVIHWDNNKQDPSENDNKIHYWDFLYGGERFVGSLNQPSTFVSPSGTWPQDGH